MLTLTSVYDVVWRECNMPLGTLFLIMMMTCAITFSWTKGHCTQTRHKKELQSLEQKLNELRLAERRGRIRAEIRVRSLTKQQRQPQQQQSQPDQHNMSLQCIGTMHTPYVKRAGTPRQGLLVPHGRGYLQIHPSVASPLCFDGLEKYSHAWVLFQFHANTDVTHKKSKIRPPRAPANVKVGTLATRSPHRPNALGLTLVKIVKVDIDGNGGDGTDNKKSRNGKTNHKKKSKNRVYVEAMDLVHGTPVYDVKPYVPLDIVGYYDTTSAISDMMRSSNGETSRTIGQLIEQQWLQTNLLRVPSWVRQHDTLSRVVFSTKARQALHALVVEHHCLQPFYGQEALGQYKHENSEQQENEEVGGMKGEVLAAEKAISEIVAQDPRASHRRHGRTKTKLTKEPLEKNRNNGKEENGLDEDDKNDSFCFLFGGLQITFVVIQEEGEEATKQEEDEKDLQDCSGTLQTDRTAYVHVIQIEKANYATTTCNVREGEDDHTRKGQGNVDPLEEISSENNHDSPRDEVDAASAHIVAAHTANITEKHCGSASMEDEDGILFADGVPLAPTSHILTGGINVD